jgi:hypothetical protein
VLLVVFYRKAMQDLLTILESFSAPLAGRVQKWLPKKDKNKSNAHT